MCDCDNLCFHEFRFLVTVTWFRPKGGDIAVHVVGMCTGDQHESTKTVDFLMH